MQTWVLITVIVAPSLAGILLCFLILRRCSSSPATNPNPNPITRQVHVDRTETLQRGIVKLHHVHNHHHHYQIDIENAKKQSYSVFRSPQKLLFSWSDHPSLVTDAVEHGWSRFAFISPYTSSSPSVRLTKSSLLGACAGSTGSEQRDRGVESMWEVSPGSADFMQKIRFNSGLRKVYSSNYPLITVIKTGLPLPGPPLGSSSFPQEAYFEITILKTDEEDINKKKRMRSESEKAKLIQQNSSGKRDSESFVHVNKMFEEMKSRSLAEEGRVVGVLLSVGLVRGGSLPLKLPGTFPGSVGFNSDGSVFLDGIKLILESQKQEWGESERVIGCGYNPMQKKVFFTLDSHLVHVITCKSDEFGTPLYPVLAANKDITVLVNFGQSAFKYSPANTQRTPNPCFIGPLGHSPTLGYDDSRELFSMGRIDTHWHDRSTTRTSFHNNGNSYNFDEESEGDLFEIVLDSNSSVKSPITVSK